MGAEQIEFAYSDRKTNLCTWQQNHLGNKAVYTWKRSRERDSP